MIRTAGRADLEQVVALWDSTAGPTMTAGGVRDARRLLNCDPDAVLVVDLDGDIVGTVVVGWDGWRVHLYRLAVRTDLRRAQIATMLVGEARRRAQSLGATRIDATVDLGNTGAIVFWESAGFDRDLADARWSLVL